MADRRRSRESWSGFPIRLIMTFVVIAVVVLGVHPAVLVTKGDLTREATVPVVDDPNGQLALDIVASIKAQGSYRELLTVTNQFDRTIQVTVSLQVPSDGDLRDNEDESGVDSVTFDLTPGEQLQVDMDVDNSLNDGYEIGFDITATATALRVEALDRSTTVQRTGPPGGGGGGGGGGQPGA